MQYMLARYAINHAEIDPRDEGKSRTNNTKRRPLVSWPNKMKISYLPTSRSTIPIASFRTLVPIPYHKNAMLHSVQRKLVS